MKEVLVAVIFLGVLNCPLIGVELTWEDLRALAQKNNPALKASRLKVESTRARVKEARGNFLPQFTGSGSYSKSNTATSLESVSQGGGGSGTRDEYSLSLTASQPLFSGFKNLANFRAAQTDLRISESDHSLLESQILRDLKSATISILYSVEKIELFKKILERKTENRKLLELRYEGGREPRGTVLRSVAQENQAKFELERSFREYLLNLHELSLVLGQDLEESTSITGELKIGDKGLAPSYGNFVLQHPSYLKSMAAEEKARRSFEEAKSAIYPSFSLSATGRRRGRDFPPESDSWSVASSFSYPLFSGGKDYFSVLSSRFNLEQSRADLEKRRREIKFRLESAYFNWVNSVDQARVQNDFLKASEERATVARAQYGQGIISYTDWDLIEADLTNAQKEMLEAKMRAAVAEADWVKAQGRSE